VYANIIIEIGASGSNPYELIQVCILFEIVQLGASSRNSHTCFTLSHTNNMQYPLKSTQDDYPFLFAVVNVSFHLFIIVLGIIICELGDERGEGCFIHS